MTDISGISGAADPTLIAGNISSFSSLSLRMQAGVDPAKVDKTARNFEAMFAAEMLQPMFEGIEVDKTFGGGHGEEIMRSFMLQEYGKVIAKSDKLGIASQVKAEMLRAQEGSHGGGKVSAGSARNAYASAANGQGAVDVSAQ